MSQSLLDAREDRRLVVAVHVDDAIGQKPGLGERGREEILTRNAPQDLAPRARGDARGEQCRSRAVDRAIAAAGDFMERAVRQSALRQMPVNRLDAERQHGPIARRFPSETLNAFTKRCENSKRRGGAHVLSTTRLATASSLFVPFTLLSQPELMLPTLAAVRTNNVSASIFYGRTTGPLSGLHGGELVHEFAREGIAITPVHKPRLHAKVLGWDDDALAVSSLNWLSADPADAALSREIGVSIEAPRIADNFIQAFEKARVD
jgi:hypothetical protein